jgi:pimeloyl-ACP methyl ester carboxylesterase
MADQQKVTLSDVEIEVFFDGPSSGERMVCAAHPADRFGAATAGLLAEMTRTRAACMNPRGCGGLERSGTLSLDQMVDRIEGVRARLGLGRWIFWGMSGGGWLAQSYARRYPEALAGIVIESACLCFRERLADPECVLSPIFPSWREPLRVAGLFPQQPANHPVSGDDTEWLGVDGIGEVFRRREGPALLVSPGPLAPEMKSVMPHLWNFDSRSWIHSIRIPALVLCGTADPVVPVRHARAVHEAIAGSSFVEIVGGGHVPVAQKRPEVTAAFQSFVSALSARSQSRG